jgi:hypothetical protein
MIFNWECNVRELRVHDPATAEQHGLKDSGFIVPNAWHEISEIRLDGMRVIVDGEVRFERSGDYAGIESALSVGPCRQCRLVREFNITLIA